MQTKASAFDPVNSHRGHQLVAFFLFMFYVYILQSEITKQFYKGQTDDLQRRLKEHNNGEEKSTAPFCPWVLVWHTSVETRSKAVILEKKIKNITSREKTADFIKRHSNK